MALWLALAIRRSRPPRGRAAPRRPIAAAACPLRGAGLLCAGSRPHL